MSDLQARGEESLTVTAPRIPDSARSWSSTLRKSVPETLSGRNDSPSPIVVNHLHLESQRPFSVLAPRQPWQFLQIPRDSRQRPPNPSHPYNPQHLPLRLPLQRKSRVKRSCPRSSAPLSFLPLTNAPLLALSSPSVKPLSAEMINHIAVVAVAASTAPGVFETWIPALPRQHLLLDAKGGRTSLQSC